MFETLFVSTGIVALAEIGDKTQLLALLLAARYRKPIPIILGILVATLVNHFLAAAVGYQVAQLFSESTLLWILAASFLAVAAWTLVPDTLDDDDTIAVKYGPFIATLIAFFIAEMGDKTQVATVMLAAQFEYFWMVICGTTIGMLLANAPVVLIGHFTAERLPLKLIRIVAATGFLAFALYCVWQALSLN
ncbi:MAG: TMEM165/GDT1 family protein [Pseudomonas sp.]|nr:TMEM165/GDT1 family protein [Pseudomonas sp.]